MFNKFRNRGSRKILLYFSDTHGGHKLGLLDPDTVLFDEDEDGELYPYHPELTATQKYLYDEVWIPGLEMVKELAGDDPVYAHHVGDITQGTKYIKSSHLVSPSIADQVSIGARNLKRCIEMLPTLKWLRLIVGTQSHELEHSSGPLLIFTNVKSDHPNIDMRVMKHGLIDCDGYVVDVAHHGPFPGSRSWLKGNVARYDLKSKMDDEIKGGNKPPDLYVRAHFHEPVEEKVSGWFHFGYQESVIVVLPSMCGLSDYARQRTRSANKLTNGMLAVEVINGKPNSIFNWFTKTIDIRTKEKI